MITVNDVSVHFGGTTLLVMFPAINENDKIAMMGKMERENRHF
jgi:ATP-binding cassette subfamily F protein 3